MTILTAFTILHFAWNMSDSVLKRVRPLDIWVNLDLTPPPRCALARAHSALAAPVTGFPSILSPGRGALGVALSSLWRLSPGAPGPFDRPAILPAFSYKILGVGGAGIHSSCGRPRQLSVYKYPVKLFKRAGRTPLPHPVAIGPFRVWGPL